MKIWIDADACPKAIKEILFRAAERRKIQTYLVANRSMYVPRSEYLQSIQVPDGFDVADNRIAQEVSPEDLVITADVPLAAIIVEKGATAINPRGTLYTEENVQERLSIRNFMQDLRDSGVTTSGPRPFGSKDKQNFAQALDRILNARRRA